MNAKTGQTAPETRSMVMAEPSKEGAYPSKDAISGPREGEKPEGPGSLRSKPSSQPWDTLATALECTLELLNCPGKTRRWTYTMGYSLRGRTNR